LSIRLSVFLGFKNGYVLANKTIKGTRPSSEETPWELMFTGHFEAKLYQLKKDRAKT